MTLMPSTPLMLSTTSSSVRHSPTIAPDHDPIGQFWRENQIMQCYWSIVAPNCCADIRLFYWLKNGAIFTVHTTRDGTVFCVDITPLPGSSFYHITPLPGTSFYDMTSARVGSSNSATTPLTPDSTSFCIDINPVPESSFRIRIPLAGKCWRLLFSNCNLCLYHILSSALR